MKLTGHYEIEALRDDVWRALNDVAILRECIPGCERLEKTSDDELEADVLIKIGPVKAKFKGAVRLETIEEGVRFRISGEGKGGAAGFAKGSAEISLSDAEEKTALDYVADTQVGGKLAQIGGRLIQATSRKLADEFFDKFQECLAGDDAQQPLEALPEAAGTGNALSRPLVWGLIIAALLIALIAIVNLGG